MTLGNIKTKKRGFTIVELLIVIVIIAILAAITIVLYNGAQDRAKSSAAQALANNVSKKADLFYTINGVFPATVTAFKAATAEAALDATTQDALSLIAPTDDKTVQYRYCDTGKGAQVVWYDTVSSTTQTVQLGSNASCADVTS